MIFTSVIETTKAHTLNNIGIVYYEWGNKEKALEYYYKVEFKADDNKKVLRPIAWILFITGKFEKAREYYERLMKSEANKYDFMNLGHVEWCLGNQKAALKNYKLK